MTRIAPLILLLTAGIGLADAARAADPSVSPASPNVSAVFGNTVMSVYPDGRSQKIWLTSDGKWTGLSRRGNPLAGTWTLKGEKICLRQSRPPTLPISFCEVFPADPAKGIDAKDLTGTPIHLKLVKGHVEAGQG
jgi:hypothetical protein